MCAFPDRPVAREDLHIRRDCPFVLSLLSTLLTVILASEHCQSLRCCKSPSNRDCDVYTVQ
jgi:hypothetical protein